MTYAPQTIVDAAKVWTSHGGLNAGIVGSFRTHCKGYHLGRDRIFSQCACKPNGHKCTRGLYGNDYSASLARDRAGLTDAAMAFDAGPINGSLPRLRSFTAWLIRECRSDTPDTQDIREIIGSVDGVHVINWLRDRGTDSQPEAGGDSTHLRHTHISYYRDTERRDKTALFRRYFAGSIPTPPDTGTDPGKEEPLNATTQKPVAIATVGACTVYADEGRAKVLIQTFGGGDVQLFSRPVVKVLADGKAALAAGRFDLAGGPAEELHVGYFGDNEISNVRLP